MIHNAGQSQRARWEHIDLAVDKSMFDLNVFSLVSLSRCIIPIFMEQGGGAFAVMSSVAGKVGVPFSGTYTGSKHATHVSIVHRAAIIIGNSKADINDTCELQGYFESLRTEKLGTGIQVTMLCPGPTFSNLLQVAATENPGKVIVFICLLNVTTN